MRPRICNDSNALSELSVKGRPFHNDYQVQKGLRVMMRTRNQYLAVVGLFLCVQALALLFAPVLMSLNLQAFDDPGDATNPIWYFILMMAVTGGVLVLIRYGGMRMLRLFFIVAVFLAAYSVFLPLTYYFTNNDYLVNLLPILIAFVLTWALWYYPEWYIVDLGGVVIGVGAASILGVSLGMLPAIILLLLLAVYDAISVYKTKHMLTLAEGVSELRLPILFVVPQKLDFDMAEMELDLKDRSKDGERSTMMMGVGDAVIPGILVVSAAIYLGNLDDGFAYTTAGLGVALSTVIGTLVGFIVLLRLVSSGRPQAGLPFLNGGALLGFLLGHLLFFGDLVFW